MTSPVSKCRLTVSAGGGTSSADFSFLPKTPPSVSGIRWSLSASGGRSLAAFILLTNAPSPTSGTGVSASSSGSCGNISWVGGASPRACQGQVFSSCTSAEKNSETSVTASPISMVLLLPGSSSGGQHERRRAGLQVGGAPDQGGALHLSDAQALRGQHQHEG